MRFSPSGHLGESLFTSTRLKNNRILFREKHLKRLQIGIEDYYLGRAMSESEVNKLSERIDQELKNLGDGESRLRISITSKDRDAITPDSFQFADLKISLEAGELKAGDGEIKCKSYPSPFSSHYPDLKMGSYMPLLRLRLMARRLQFDEAALVDREGNLLELTTSNLFFYKGKRIFTPKRTILDGVIKKAICEEWAVEELDITPGSAGEFDGAFCTNSVWIAKPVQSIDQTKFKNTGQRFVEDMINKILERGYQ